WTQLAQAHGQVQALGYTLLFILAVGLQLFPRFLGAPLIHVQRAQWGAGLVALALVARLVGQPLAPGVGRVTVLVFSVLALPVGMLIAGSVFHGLSRRSAQPDSGPSAAWRRFVVVAGLALGAGSEVAILCTWLWVIGMYDNPSRESGTPYVTNPTRRWVRLAFAFLVFSLALDVVLFGREALYGTAPSLTELSAARHALAQGFLLPLMVSMASRLLPIYSADVLRRRLLLEITVDVLLVGAFVRVGAELIGGYQAVAGPLVALGGVLGVAGFAVFAAGMWSSLARLPKSMHAPD